MSARLRGELAPSRVRQRALISLQVDYRAWMRYEIPESRYAARNMAWVLSGRLCYSRFRR